MKIELLNMDNMEFRATKKADLIYCDMIYENLDLKWIPHYFDMLKEGGVFVVQTDWHSLFEVGHYLKYGVDNSYFLNHIAWKNEFGNFPKDKFRQSHDDIIIFTKGKDYKFYPDRMQVPKATAKSKGLNPSGRTTKLATSVWMDICLTTVSKERVKKKSGKSIRWQKPLKLMDRICQAFTDEGDYIIDPFAGSATLGEWCKENNRKYTGIEYSEDVWELGFNRLFGS